MSEPDLQPAPIDWDSRVDLAAAKSRSLALRSQEIIGRSRKLRDKGRDAFRAGGLELSDEQRVAITDRENADMHQRQIEREIRATLWREDHPS